MEFFALFLVNIVIIAIIIYLKKKKFDSKLNAEKDRANYYYNEYVKLKNSLVNEIEISNEIPNHNQSLSPEEKASLQRAKIEDAQREAERRAANGQ